MRMERWGTELWDRWDAVVEQVSAGTQEMAAVYARFLNERAKVGGRHADICSYHYFDLHLPYL